MRRQLLVVLSRQRTPFGIGEAGKRRAAEGGGGLRGVLLFSIPRGYPREDVVALLDFEVVAGLFLWTMARTAASDGCRMP